MRVAIYIYEFKSQRFQARPDNRVIGMGCRDGQRQNLPKAAAIGAGG